MVFNQTSSESEKNADSAGNNPENQPGVDKAQVKGGRCGPEKKMPGMAGYFRRVFPEKMRAGGYISPCIRDRFYVFGILWLFKLAVEWLQNLSPVDSFRDGLFEWVIFFPLYKGYSAYHVVIPVIIGLGAMLLCGTMAHWVGDVVELYPLVMRKKSGVFRHRLTEIEYQDIRSLHIEKNLWQFLVGTGDIYISTDSFGCDIIISGVSRPGRFLEVIWARKGRSVLRMEYLKRKSLEDFSEDETSGKGKAIEKT